MPADIGFEIAFIGRSNAGKSSALNTITGIKNLARVSKTPGRTQMINLFSVDASRRLIDLPGYGYAKVPKEIKVHWDQLIDDYLKTRHCLRGLIVVMDSRHPMTEMDCEVIEWALECEVPLHLLLTKVDKLAKNAMTQTLRSVQEQLSYCGDAASVQLFSSSNRTGLEEARAVLDRWFNYT